MGEETITEYFEADRMVPAAGQGALGVEARADDLEIQTLLDAITIVVAKLRCLQSGCVGRIGWWVSSSDWRKCTVGGR